MRLFFIETGEFLEVIEIGDYYQIYSPRMGKTLVKHKSKFRKINI